VVASASTAAAGGASGGGGGEGEDVGGSRERVESHVRQKTVLNPNDLASIAQSFINPSNLESTFHHSKGGKGGKSGGSGGSGGDGGDGGNGGGSNGASSETSSTSSTSSSTSSTSSLSTGNLYNNTYNRNHHQKKKKHRTLPSSQPPRVDPFALFSGSPRTKKKTSMVPAVDNIFGHMEPQPVRTCIRLFSSFRTFFPYILSVHSFRTFFPCILSVHFFRAFFPYILSVHSFHCATPCFRLY
jgi:hypothetical protein